MKYEYQKLMGSIHAPEGLERRVLEAAREQDAAGKAARRSARPALRAAACAVLALVLVAGGVGLYPRRESTMEDNGTSTVQPPLTYTFGLTACAVEELQWEKDLLSGGRPGTVNGSLLLGAKKAEEVTLTTTELDPEEIQYTDYRFRIRGENIREVTLSIDRGGLYRYDWGKNTPLGASVSEAYDPDAAYGLWVAITEPLWKWEREQGSVLYDGAKLTVSVTFTDGTAQTEVYQLTAQALQAVSNEDGTTTLIPVLEGGESDVVGLYVEPENSVWFQWPVEGAHTVSLSAPYGLRPDGAYFHSGIDIPAQQGTSVLAAAAGTVTEAGFDSDRGNYLVLDHGGGMETVYAHCLSLAAEVGDAVAAEEEIAAVGATGMATGPHLHFEVRQDGEAQNPIAFFDAAVRNTLKMG